jgi:dolichyl-diphosphooligosaccharide--protein glycosyltransferase
MQVQPKKNLFEKLNTFKPALTATILLIIFTISFFVRIFSVIKYESIIHEFDPWFNFRATKYLAEKGIAEFQYWFDSESWYPLGRFVGHTVFPGLMYTTVFVKKILELLLIPLDIKHICVFTAPVFSCVTCFYGYKITK